MSPELETVAPAADRAPRAGPRRAPLGPAAAPSKELRGLKDRYLAWMVATRYARTTVKGVHADLEWLLKFLALRGVGRVADVTPEVLNDYSLWLRELPNAYKSGKTIGLRHVFHRLSVVKWFFKWLGENMLVLYDPAQDLELPRLGQGLPQTILSQKEAQRLLDAPDLRSPVGYRDKALLELAYATGLRSGELFKLKVADVDLAGRTLQIRKGKGAKDAVLPLPALTAGYLKEYMEKVRPRFAANMKGGDDGTLFLSWQGGRLDQTRLGEVIKRQAKAAGIDKRVTAMTLRHSIASHLLENGMGIRYIQEMLRHEKLGSTQLYVHRS